MKQAIIDIGSNSIRLTLYQIKDDSFKILFREKIMAGLASYVEDGKLSEEGIECACKSLLTFKATLETLAIDNITVFATASLRNISNTKEALTIINAATNYKVEVITGEEEALLGYKGAMKELSLDSGSFLDVGGASSEIVIFEDHIPIDFLSYPIGSLSLYRRCVKGIIPKDKSLKRLSNEIKNTINIETLKPQQLLVCVGGTSRALLKFTKSYFHLNDDCNYIKLDQLDKLCEFLCNNDRDSINLILKLAPERIHTIIPGILVIKYVAHALKTEKLLISNYGVREGYLCQKVITTPKIEK